MNFHTLDEMANDFGFYRGSDLTCYNSLALTEKCQSKKANVNKIYSYK
jgi:hypothetical protein